MEEQRRHRTVRDTVEFIIAAHALQLDKSGVEYWRHPMRVAYRLRYLYSDVLLHAALLHDVLEDVPGVTPLALRDVGYSPRVVDIVCKVSQAKDTRDKGKTYQEWIQWIANSGDQDAILVKYANLLDNSAPSRLASLPEKDRGIATRYVRALLTIEQALPADVAAKVQRGDIDFGLVEVKFL